MREDFDPCLDVRWRAEGDLCAAMIDWCVEKDTESSAEGGCTRARETCADDLYGATRLW
jgi:hypothetical protein